MSAARPLLHRKRKSIGGLAMSQELQQSKKRRYSITSSASESKLSDIVIPSALAVFMLMKNGGSLSKKKQLKPSFSFERYISNGRPT
jgi:hypothetical protein